VSTLRLRAAGPGAWGNELRISIDHLGITDELARRFGLVAADLFNLTVTLGADGPSEKFVNLSVKEGPRRVDRVLEQQSQWLRLVALPTPVARPADGSGQLAGGDNGATLETGDYAGSEVSKTGIFALEKADLFNLLCIPPDQRGADTDSLVYQAALPYCVRRRAILIVDPPGGWDTALPDDVKDQLGDLGLSGSDATNAVLYYPRLVQADPLRENQPDAFAPCGAVAGVIARTDTQRGIWKAPAGLDASVGGIQKLAKKLTDKENGILNPVAINCLRTFPVTGTVVWGARTLRGADQLGSEWKYLPVRRVALFIEESLYRGTQWVVFEPNDEPLWAQIRLNVGAFMNDLFRQGAFQGSSPKDAYFVKCDKETTTQSDINRGIVNIIVGFAPLKPAEFVVIKLQQMAGQIQA
jgi:phage tail sheath protein FI